MLSLQVGRLGRCDNDVGWEGRLTPRGERDAADMSWQLLHGRWTGGLILASNAWGAAETARIMHTNIRSSSLVESPYIYSLGMRPGPVGNVWHFVGEVLTRHGVDHSDLDVAVITHPPFVNALAQAIAGHRAAEHGVLYPVTENLVNPLYDPGLAAVADQKEPW